MKELFHKTANVISKVVGSPIAFVAALVIIGTWALSGPVFGYSDTWQLIINTGTTIVTFLIVFLIQNTQNRDAKAIHLKLDELIKTQKGARDTLIDIEDITDKELEDLRREFKDIHDKYYDTLIQKGGIFKKKEKKTAKVK